MKRIGIGAALLALSLSGSALAQSGIEQRLIGEWNGVYRCGQGETGLTLTFARKDGALAGEFKFFPVPSNPDVPSGRYAMKVSVAADGTVHGTQNYWLAQPTNYIMVDINGRLDPAGTTFAGRIVHPTCQEFVTTKRDTVPEGKNRATAVPPVQ